MVRNVYLGVLAYQAVMIVYDGCHCLVSIAA